MEPIIEGSTRLLPPRASNVGDGPGTHDRDVPFYNPGMALNRDLSVLLVAAEARRRGRELDVADVLAGAGARSLRLANEVEEPLIVHANDGDPNAIEAIHAGQAENGIAPERLNARQGNAHAFLASRRFDIVDIDPFGSPMPFLDAAVRAVRHDGLVCLTATDTGALAGTHPKACRRRYAAEPLHAPEWRTEVGLRILAGCLVRAAGRLDRGAEAVMSVSRGHWSRVVMRIRDGRGAGDKANARMGFVQEDPATSQAVWAKSGAGPLWQGRLHDPELMQLMQEDERALANPNTAPLVDNLVAEADAAPFWAHIPHLHSRLGGDGMPRRAAVLQAIQAAGGSTAPSHMDIQGVRTDLEPAKMALVWKDLTAKA